MRDKERECQRERESKYIKIKGGGCFFFLVMFEFKRAGKRSTIRALLLRKNTVCCFFAADF